MDTFLAIIGFLFMLALLICLLIFFVAIIGAGIRSIFKNKPLFGEGLPQVIP
jgi:hypothetical protein